MRLTIILTLLAALSLPPALTRVEAGPDKDKQRSEKTPAGDVRGGEPSAPPPGVGEGVSREGDGRGGRMGFGARRILKNAFEARMEAERLHENTEKLEEDKGRLKRDRDKFAKDPKTRGISAESLERREKILGVKAELLGLEKEEFINKTKQNTAAALEEIGRRRKELEKNGHDLPPMLDEFEENVRAVNEATTYMDFDVLYDLIASSDESIDMGVGDPARLERLRREREVLRRRLNRIDQELGLAEGPDGMPPPPDVDSPSGPPAEDSDLYKGTDTDHPGPPSRDNGPPPPRGDHPRRPR